VDSPESNVERTVVGEGDGTPAKRVSAEFERGLRFAHIMLMVNKEAGSEAVAYVQALADVLVAKGIVKEEELDAPLARAREEIAKVPTPQVRLADIGDKYAEGETVDIDCASLIPLCHGRCCTLRFFLTKQDLEEGVARWDYGNPYWIKQGADGYCTHSEPTTRACRIHAARPHICRKYDCRNDKRIWLDFAKRIPAPMPAQFAGDAPPAMAEVALQSSLNMAPPEVAQGLGVTPNGGAPSANNKMPE
jgi:Fe-S-cluster containining protein